MIVQRITMAVNESNYRPKDLLQEGAAYKLQQDV